MPSRRRHLTERPWIPAFVLAFGLLSVVMLLLNDRIRQRSAVEDALSLRTCEQLRVDVAISHLWLEEYVSGDSVDLDEIRPRLDKAIERLDQLAGNAPGPVDGAGELTSPPLHDAALRHRAAALRPLFETFRTLSEERQQGYARRLPVGIGSALDVEYDQVFDELLHAVQTLAADLQEHHRQHNEDAQQLFWTLLILWGLLVLVAALALWVRQQRAEKALLESQAQLTHSQRMDAAGRLAGGLAHDLSNYLAAIRGHCELTRLKSPGGADLAQKMDEVIGTVDRASGLVDNLLAFGRRQPVHPETVDLRSTLEGLANMMTPSMGDRVQLVTDLPPDLWPVFLDRAGIEQAMVNLLVNAKDAMAEGGTVHLSARNLSSEESPVGEERVEIVVGDGGCGIPAEDLDKIFEPFWSTKRAAGGSGLGLAMVYGFVQQCGGRLSVESKVGQGTVFRLLLPVADDKSPRQRKDSRSAADSPAMAADAAGAEGSDGLEPSDESLGLLNDDPLEGSETLLLVDDNIELRNATQEVLEALGYRVFVAGDGRQALSLAERHEIDLWIVDWVLPDMDGRQVLARLRRGAEAQHKRAFLISGHHPEELTRHGEILPADDDPTTRFLSKRDLSAFRLAQLIRRWIDQGPTATPTGPSI